MWLKKELWHRLCGAAAPSSPKYSTTTSSSGLGGDHDVKIQEGQYAT